MTDERTRPVAATAGSLLAALICGLAAWWNAEYAHITYALPSGRSGDDVQGWGVLASLLCALAALAVLVSTYLTWSGRISRRKTVLIALVGIAVCALAIVISVSTPTGSY